MKGPGQQRAERHDTDAAVSPAAVERDLRDVRSSLTKERYVAVRGRAEWARGVDEARTVTNRQVFRSLGGVFGRVKRAVVSFAQDGTVRTKSRAALSTYETGALSTTELGQLRRLLDHYRVADDVETD